jgi:serine phosphatase RsbU (regulator of sigma subunit)
VVTSRGGAASAQGNESEIVVAIVRTFLIGLAALALWSRAIGLGEAEYAAFRASLIIGGIYNAVLLGLYWRGRFMGAQRYLLLLADLLLISAWVHFAGVVDVSAVSDSVMVDPTAAVESVVRVFPFYYVLVIVAAIWYGLAGALVTACVAVGACTVALWQPPGNDVLASFTPEAMTQQYPILGLIALLAGYLWDTQRREREAWQQTQRLLTIYQERIRISQALYELFVPQSLPQAPGLDLGYKFRPALRMGAGDYYEVIALDRGRQGICIADVAGKVTTATVKVPLLKYALRVAATLSPSPSEVLSRVNRILYPELQPDLFITACYLVIDPETGESTYASAGHQPPILIEQGSTEPRLLTTAAMPMGVDDAVNYPEESFRLGPADTLIFYTDGVTDARSPERQEYGEGNLLACARRVANPGRSAQEVAQAIFDDVNQFARQGERRDDMTVLVVRLAAEGETAPEQ